MSSSESKSGFTVTDRRAFSSTGEAKDAETAPPAPAAPPAPEAPAAAEASRARALPVDFGTFVLSLGSSAIMHLGELPAEEGGTGKKDLPLAKHTIDILSMLQAKTKGNLTAQEDRLLESLLYDLRLRFVSASKG